MAAEEVLRLAWLSDRDGRSGMRDALLTLAIADSGTEDAVTAERARRSLIARRPNHWFSSYATLGQALADPRIRLALARLRTAFPAARVQRLLFRGEVQRGPYTGRRPALSLLLEDLLGPSPRGAGRPPLPCADADARSFVEFYLSVLLALAILLSTLQPPASNSNDTRAA